MPQSSFPEAEAQQGSLFSLSNLDLASFPPTTITTTCFSLFPLRTHLVGPPTHLRLVCRSLYSLIKSMSGPCSRRLTHDNKLGSHRAR